MKIEKKYFKILQLYIKRFEQAENTVEAISFLDKMLNLLLEHGNEDERLNNYIKEICQKFNFQLGTNWKKIEIYFPEINSFYSVNKYLFMKEELENKILNNGETAWNRLKSNVLLIFDWCDVRFGQAVPLFIIP